MTSPMECFLDQPSGCVAGVQAPFPDVDSGRWPLKAGVKLQREKGRGRECSLLLLISVRFQQRFVKR